MQLRPEAHATSPNFAKLGLEFVQISISLKNPKKAREIISYFDNSRRCLFAIECFGKYDLIIEVHVEGRGQLNGIMDGFREKYSQECEDFDIATVTKEYLVVWGPFGE